MTRSLRILMVAPQPFLRSRGTPFSVFHRIRSLLHLGHRVDLLTYPYGEPVELDGLRLVRSRRPPGVRDVPIGPSPAKAVADVPLFLRALRMARSGRYDLVHTHEEAGMLGAFLRRRMGLTHLYDMHSSLPQQLANFDRYDWPPVVGIFERLERYTLEGSDGVIAICEALGDRAREVGYGGPLQVIENTLDLPPPPDLDERAAKARTDLGLEGDERLVVYTGSLEPYQGLETLLAAVPRVLEREPRARFLVVGGAEAQSEAFRREAAGAGVADAVLAVPAVPPEEVHVYHRLADILVTTRSRGTNTPLKIYQYLRAGRPIVATRIHAHTQVLDPSAAELVPTDPDGVAAGILRVLAHPERGRTLAHGAAELARGRYGDAAYHRRLASLLERIGSEGPTAGARATPGGGG
jgi:glycosyltransferase involved in cell wall biosynthesis